MLPCGQGLWLYLITGPHTTAIPGLFRAGRAGMAEELGWPVEAFDKAFQEASSQGMVKADFEHRVVWLPNAIKHNKPASPNVVTSWAAGLELIPECDLKTEALAGLGAFLGTLDSSYLKTFHAICKFSKKLSPKPSRKPSNKAMPNQEQEPEQQPEQQQQQQQANTLALPAGAAPATSPVFIILILNDKTEYSIDEKQISEWESLYPAVDVRHELRKYKGWADAKPERRKTRKGIRASVNSWLAKEQDKSRLTGGNNEIGQKLTVPNTKQERSRAAIQKASRNF